MSKWVSLFHGLRVGGKALKIAAIDNMFVESHVALAEWRVADQKTGAQRHSAPLWAVSPLSHCHGMPVCT